MIAPDEGYSRNASRVLLLSISAFVFTFIGPKNNMMSLTYIFFVKLMFLSNLCLFLKEFYVNK
jgi:hypothetical protein